MYSMTPQTWLVLPQTNSNIPYPTGLPLNSNTTPAMTDAGVIWRWVVLTPWVTPATAPVAQPIPDVNSIYTNYLDQFKDNQATSNLLKTAYNDYGAFSQWANNINQFYNNLYNETDPYYNTFAKINQWLDSDITNQLRWQLATAYGQYGPEWEQTRRVAEYYADAANNIAQQNAAAVWQANVDATASWANTGAVRQATAKAELDANTNYINLKQKEIENYDNIYKNLNTYIDNYIKTYGNSKDKYVRDTYNQLLQYKQGIEQAKANSLISLEWSRLQKQLQDETQAKALASRWVILTPEQQAKINAYDNMQKVNNLSQYASWAWI